MNKEFYRIVNGKLEKFNGGFVVYNNRIYTNPKEETLRLVGYKDNLVYGDMPEYNPQTQYLNEIYTEDDKAIYVNYEVVDIECEEIENTLTEEI